MNLANLGLGAYGTHYKGRKKLKYFLQSIAVKDITWMSDLFAHLTKLEFDTYVSVKTTKFLILRNATSMSATN